MVLALQTSSSTPYVDLGAPYRELLAGHWRTDAGQFMAVARLQSLANALMSDLPRPPRGLWLYGPPGRGKSALLDLFMKHLPLPNKRRVHFHSFMDELHRRLHGMPPKPGEDYVDRLAHEIAAEAQVLGFDEFYLTNLPDAMMLGRLMDALFRRGVVVVATSNWALPDLFQGGLNRDRFLPLLRTLERNLEPLDMGGAVDYRRYHKPVAKQYVSTRSGESDSAQLSVLFDEFSNGPSVPLPAYLTARKVKGAAVWLTFPEICEKSLGRHEYQELARSFHTFIIEGIPRLDATDADAALRLATLVDILYEHRCRLAVSAAVPPAELCREGAAAQVFRRTASRLMEMTGG